MTTWHKEIPKAIDGICVDCKKFYECFIREAAENERNSHVVECGQFEESRN